MDVWKNILLVLAVWLPCSRAAIAETTFLARVGNAAPETTENTIDRLIDQGYRFRMKGESKQALEAFEKAHALSPSPRTLGQIALAEGDLERWVVAESHLAEALGSRDSAWIEKNRDVLTKALASIRSHIGLVTVMGPAGAEVLVDGNLAGKLPLSAPLHVAEGKVRLEGRAEGRQTAGTDVVVPGGGTVTLELDLPLVAVPVATHPVAHPPEPPPPALPAPDGGTLERASWKTPVGVTLLVAGGALLTLGAVWIAVDGKKTACGTTAPGTSCPEYDTSTKGWVVAGIGAAAAVGGGLILYSNRSSRSATVALSLAPTGAFFAGQF